MRRLWTSCLLAPCALGMFTAPPIQAQVSGSSSGQTPQQIVARYFADLHAHRFHAAWLLEAPCRVTISVPNGPGAPMGSESYAGKGAWYAPAGKYAAHPVLASATVRRISRLHMPNLERHHVLAFGVSGWFRFDYSAATSNGSVNNKHTSGFHVIKLGMWQCNGRWGVEPSYWLIAGGGDLNWT